MNVNAATTRHPSLTRDRDVIRFDFADDKLGIAASLRQAFTAAAHDQSTHDFDKLLRELD